LSCDSDAPQVGSALSDWTRGVKVNRLKTNRRKGDPAVMLFLGVGDPREGTITMLRRSVV